MVNKLICGDCLEEMKKLKDGSVDLIITSPPYNLGNNHHTENKRHQIYDDNMKEENYQRLQIEILNECYRVLKQDGSMMYNHKNRIKNKIQISPYEWLFKTKFLIKQEIVWINGSPNFDKIRFYPFTERVYWLVKDKKTKLCNTINKYDVFYSSEWKPVGTGGSHKRAFPVQMVTDLISVFPESKLILDPYMGSGTTGVGCKILNKNFIGIELDKEYFEISKKRINSFTTLNKYFKNGK